MLVIESYREGRISRGQSAEMLGLGFHEPEVLLRHYGADQPPTWEEMEQSANALKSFLGT
jgi:predicted HTH domain antitoxin